MTSYLVKCAEPSDYVIEFAAKVFSLTHRSSPFQMFMGRFFFFFLMALPRRLELIISSLIIDLQSASEP